MFGDVVALEGIDLSIGSGEFLSFLGPSGCGKTTALRLVAGFDKPDVRERARRRAEHGRRQPEPARHGHGVPGLQPVPQHDGRAQRRVRPADRGDKKGDRPRTRGRAARARRAQRGREAVSAPVLRRHAAARRACPRACDRAPVLLLDEPLSALDAKVRVQLREEIRRIQTRARDHDDLRDTRPGGGALHLGSRRRACRRAASSRSRRLREIYGNPVHRTSPSSSAR